MLSFINMGGRKKRPRKKGSRSFNGPNTRGNRLASRGSGSFMTSGTFGEVVIERPAARPFLSGEPSRRSAVTGKKGDASSASVQVPSAPKRSPEIQLEFKHDSLLQSLPEEFLKYRKGSSASSVDDVNTRRSPNSQVTDRTLNLEGGPGSKRMAQEKTRRMAPMRTVTPIKIPASPLQSVPPRSQQHISRIRRSLTTNSPAWGSDSEVSPVSGLSAARDVLAESFSFSVRGNTFGESSAKERDSGGRIARQDSATLPRENVWEGPVRSPSVSRKSSARSLKKRKHDVSVADLPPLEAFVLSTPLFRKDEPNSKTKPEVKDREHPPIPLRKDSMRGRQRAGITAKSPPPPSLIPSAQKLGQSDQDALHRISRITEADAEASSSSVALPVSGSTSDSFSSRSRRGLRLKVELSSLGSSSKVPSVLSTPSTYSKYTGSPFASPGKSAGANSNKSEYDYESFLEDFDFVGPLSGPSSRGEKSGYAGSADSPNFAQVPMTATSTSTMSGLNSASATGSSGFPQGTASVLPSRIIQNSMVKRRMDPSASLHTSPSAKTESSASLSGHFPRDRTRDGSSFPIAVNVGKPLVPSSEPQKVLLNGKNVASESKGVDANANGTIPNAAFEAQSSCNPLNGQSLGLNNSKSEKLRPFAPQLHVSNPGLSPSSPSSVSPLSCHSPDLLDILIPNGYIVTPISRRQVGRKRSGSTPSPIKITPRHSTRYLPMNGDDDDELGWGGVRDSVPKVPLGMEDALLSGDIQTFPETPVLFSPDFAMSILSRANSLTSDAKYANGVSRSSLRNVIPLQSLVTVTVPQASETTKALAMPAGDNDRPSVNNESASLLTVISNSPPISPLQPPPSSPVVSIPNVQTLTDLARPSPPLLAPVPRRKTFLIRPPLPFGPRRPNAQMGKVTATATAPLSFAPRRTASESAAGIARLAGNAKPLPRRAETPLPTPTFKTTPVAWRGLTLEAAKWTFSSAQLQGIVRKAIEESAQASSIKLLSQDVLENLVSELSKLEARCLDIQNDYKVLVRRRRSVIQRLTSLSSEGPRTDSASVVRDAEELAKVTASCDRLVEEMHSVDDQITQVCRLRDVHQASALAVALRKLNASLTRQTSETQRLQSEVVNLHAEKNEAWRKAEMLEHELDEQFEQAGTSRPKSVSSSRRSSRVSLARKNSSRTSKAGLRLSGYSYRRTSQRYSGSSLLVHHSTSARTTFSSDAVPPVPPLPVLDPSILSSTNGMPLTSLPQSSAILSTSDGLYNAVYDLLGVRHADRSMPFSSRPHSAIYHSEPSSSHGYNQKQDERTIDAKLVPTSHSEFVTRLRSGSLPTSIPSQPEIEDADAIVAMLDFRD